jgi:hypothetical protein
MPAAGHHAFPVGRRAGVEGNTSHISTHQHRIPARQWPRPVGAVRKTGLRSYRIISITIRARRTS